MIRRLKSSGCVGCGACKSACPKNAIRMVPDSLNGFLYPEIDEDMCVKCEKCILACPEQHESRCSADKSIFAVYSKDETSRISSSSGGVFSLLANEVLKENGVVFGVAMTDDCYAAEHVSVCKGEDIDKIRGSKYLQSDTKDSFRAVRSALENSERVLFCGTPCQVAGLRSYLQKDHENLLTVDFVCHGVPSPLAWKKYVSDLEAKEGSKLEMVIFRDKAYGWRKNSLRFLFKNQAERIHLQADDKYMKGFISNLYLRPSCYKCKYKDKGYASDITLGDFWGISKICPEIDSEKGISLVIYNTEKGMEYAKKIVPNAFCKKIESKDVFASNPSYVSSVKKEYSQKTVYRDLKKNTFDKFISRYCENSLAGKFRRAFLRLLGSFVD